MDLSHEIVKEYSLVTMLHVAGTIDYSNYLVVINKVKELFDNGTEYLLLDLEACHNILSSGLFALHSIALIAHNISPFDPEEGWNSLHQIKNESRELKERFKIVHIQANISKTLEAAGLLSFFDIYSEIQAAVAAFKLKE